MYAWELSAPQSSTTCKRALPIQVPGQKGSTYTVSSMLVYTLKHPPEVPLALGPVRACASKWVAHPNHHIRSCTYTQALIPTTTPTTGDGVCKCAHVHVHGWLAHIPRAHPHPLHTHLHDACLSTHPNSRLRCPCAHACPQVCARPRPTHAAPHQPATP